MLALVPLLLPTSPVAAASGGAPASSAAPPGYSSVFHATTMHAGFAARGHRSSVQARPPIRRVSARNPAPPSRWPRVGTQPGLAAPLTSGFPRGYIPCDLYDAYGLNNTGLNGAGTVIAVIDAYDPTPIGTDLQGFDATFGLPDPAFAVYTQSASPPANPGWDAEITLDVEWAHAIAPRARIDLVLADTASLSDLLSAVDYAVGTLDADVVSMSFSAAEGDLGGRATEDGIDAWSPTNGAGRAVTYLAATGDEGWDTSSGTPGQPPWPGTDPRVVAVGGTSLTPQAFGYSSQPGSHFDCSGTTLPAGVNSGNEWVWGNQSCTPYCAGTGGGPSLYEPTPAYQTGTTTSTLRATPDVSMLADPFTGVALLQNGSWFPGTVGGTSLATPLWAGVVALLDQERNMRAMPGISVNSPSSSWVYSAPSQDFNDIQFGSDPAFTGDPCVPAAHCVPLPGYDMVSGRGSPRWANLLSDVAGTGPGGLRTAFTAVSPVRIMDTRPAPVGLGPGPMGPGQTRTQQVTGRNGVPSTASAIVVNVGVTDTQGASGYVLVYPCATSRPVASTVNWLGGQTIAILTQVALGPGGCLNVYNAAGQADVFLDLQGYFTPATVNVTTTGLYRPLDTPYRAVDTRAGFNAPRAPLGPNGTLRLQVAGNGHLQTSPAIPAPATAVTLNLTEVNGSSPSYLSAYPSPGGSTPCPAALSSSNLNFPASRILANRATVKVGPDGAVCLYNSAGMVDILVDLVGWYSSGQGGDNTGMTFSPTVPTRVYDSRDFEPPRALSGSSSGACANGNDVTITMPPAITGAVSTNTTVLSGDSASYLEVYPTGSAPTSPTSDINFRPGDILPNLVVTKLGTGSAISVCNAVGHTQFFVDVNGGYS